MEELYEALIHNPLPCVGLHTEDEAHRRFGTSLLSCGKKISSTGQNRLCINYLNDMLDANEDNNECVDGKCDKRPCWMDEQNSEPTCIISFRDWQHFQVLSDKRKNDSNSSRSTRAEPGENPSGTPAQSDISENGDGNDTVRSSSGSFQQLADHIKEDILSCLSRYKAKRKNTSPPCKILFLVLMHPELKNPQKAVSNLKNLDPNDVAAICVASGVTGLEEKLTKVEQLVFELSLGYYETKLQHLSKLTSKLKYALRKSGPSNTEIKLATLYFKMAYYSQILGNVREAQSYYNNAWNLARSQQDSGNDALSIALYSSIRMLQLLVKASNLDAATFLADEICSYLKEKLYSQRTHLYYTASFLLHASYAHNLENVSQLLYAHIHLGWAVGYLLKLMREFKNDSKLCLLPEDMGAILFSDDDDLNSLNVDVAHVDVAQQDEWRRLHSLFSPRLMKLIITCSTCGWHHNFIYYSSAMADAFVLFGKFAEACYVYFKLLESLIQGTTLELESWNEFDILESLNSDHPLSHNLNISLQNATTTLLMLEVECSCTYPDLVLRLLSKFFVALQQYTGQSYYSDVSKLAGIGPLEYPFKNPNGIDDNDSQNPHALTSLQAIGYATSILVKCLISICSVEPSLDLMEHLDEISKFTRQNISSYVVLAKANSCRYAINFSKIDKSWTIHILVHYVCDVEVNQETDGGYIYTSIGTFQFVITRVEHESGINVLHCKDADTGCVCKLEKSNLLVLSLVPIIKINLAAFQVYGICHRHIPKESSEYQLQLYSLIPALVKCGNLFTDAVYFGDCSLNPKVFDIVGLKRLSIVNMRCVSRVALVDSVTTLLNAPLDAKCGKLRGVASTLKTDTMERIQVLVSSLKFRAFVGDVVEGYATPVAFILLYDDTVFTASVLRCCQMVLEVASNTDAVVFYSLCMRNSKPLFQAGSKAHLGFEAILDANKIVLADAAIDKNEDFIAHPCVFNVPLDWNFDSRIKTYIQANNKYKSLVFWGLINIFSRGPSEVEFNLHLLEEANKALVKSHVVDINVYEPLLFQLKNISVVDNKSGNNNYFVGLELVNSTSASFEIPNIAILEKQERIAENDAIFGFKNRVFANETVACMYRDELKCMHIHVTSFVSNDGIYPNGRIGALYHTETKVHQKAPQTYPVELTTLFKNPATFCEPFELTARIHNQTDYAMELMICLSDHDAEHCPFLVAGPKCLDVAIIAGSTIELVWTLIATRCGDVALPRISCEHKRQYNVVDSSFGPFEARRVYIVP